MGPTWGPPGFCRPQMGPMLAPWTLLSGFCSSRRQETHRERLQRAWSVYAFRHTYGKLFHVMSSTQRVSAFTYYRLACRTSLIATRFLVVVICPIIKCLTVLEFSFILFDLCLFITIFNFILNYVPIVTFWIFTYHKIWILLIIFCFI